MGCKCGLMMTEKGGKFFLGFAPVPASPAGTPACGCYRGFAALLSSITKILKGAGWDHLCPAYPASCDGVSLAPKAHMS